MPVPRQKRAQAQLLREPFVPCGKCHRGIVSLNPDRSPYDRLRGGPCVMQECPCKAEWRRRIRLAEGQPAAPPAERSKVARMPYRD